MNGGIVHGLVSEVSHLCFSGKDEDASSYKKAAPTLATEDIIDDFEVVEDESKPIFFTEPDGTTCWISQAWLK